jgi:hypothetical protein
MWLVMLESAMDRILGVDTPEQPVSPRVRYRTSCLLIRGAVRSVPCSDEWEVSWKFAQAYMVQEGPWYREGTSNYRSKAWHMTHSKPM